MGAATFFDKAEGTTVRKAFDSATADARYEHGHGGYSGSLAEKREYVIITPPFIFPEGTDEKEAFKQVLKYAESLIEDGDERINDKWGPAGCIKYAPDKYLFFGWASS